MSLRSIVVLSLLAGATGCWRESCDYGDSCVERLTGVFDSGAAPDIDDDWCNGDPEPFSSCEDLGYTVECDGFWYRPERATYMCR